MMQSYMSVVNDVIKYVAILALIVAGCQRPSRRNAVRGFHSRWSVSQAERL
jgi:hypothetical protein